MFDPKSPIRPNILRLEPYRCARDDFKDGILLDANENTHGSAIRNITAEQDKLELNRYPDPHQLELKQQIADFRNSAPNALFGQKSSNAEKLGPDNIVLGVGSDESIDLLIRCCCQPAREKILICPPTYGMYEICSIVNDVEVETVPLKYPSFQIDVDGIISKLQKDSSIKLVFLTSPGNPTGKLLDIKDIITILDKVACFWNGYVVVDEAYIDFTNVDDPSYSMSTATLVSEYPNLATLQTLSKSFGLAGIRLGITFTNKILARYLNAMKYPYNISCLTSDIALKATKEGLDMMKTYVDKINVQKAEVLEKLQQISGIGKLVGGLDSNFLLLEVLDANSEPSNEVAKNLYNSLAAKEGIVLRFRGKELNCTGCLRVSIGTEFENEKLIEKIRVLLPNLRK